MKYFSHIIRPHGYMHSECFVEIARAFDEALRELDLYDLNGTGIIFGGHLEKNLPENSIIYNSEQVFSWDYLQTLKKHRVWDYSENNILKLAEKGINAELIPIAYMPSMTCIEKQEEDIPVLMYGSQNERRLKIYNDLKSAGVDVFYAYNVYGKERDDLIARSKIILNVHFYKEAIFEIFRCAHLFANDKFVVAEFGNDCRLDNSHSSDAIFTRYENLVTKCKDVLETDYKMASRGFKKTSLVNSLRNI